jgi:hypothetical protein
LDAAATRSSVPGGRHALLVHPDLHGPEYGMLRDFEQAIVAATGAQMVSFPAEARDAAARLPLGTRKAPLRRFIRRTRMRIDADTVWVVCMGAENNLLDLVALELPRGARKLVYIFDTLPHQDKSTQQLVLTSDVDLLITSFPDAVPRLNRITGRSWQVVLQGASAKRFEAVELAKRGIAFSSYGRRLDAFHHALRDWSVRHGRYYDFQTSTGVRADVPCDDLYRQYAWHVGHSVFSVCWSVESTNPIRAGNLSPITCRWFEAAMAGAAIIGRAPTLDAFFEVFPRELVTPVPDGVDVDAFLDEIWDRRQLMHERAMDWRGTLADRWSWDARVDEILRLLADRFD